MRSNKKNSGMLTDIIIVGAGPAGLAFACKFAETKMKIVIVEIKKL